MFTHHGKTRTPKHNRKIASLLSFVAGTVNIVGFLSIQRLTTNVTGHFAYFVDDVFKLDFVGSAIYLLYILFFLLGSFSSNLLIEVINTRSEQLVFVIPTIIESIILLTIALIGYRVVVNQPNIIAFSLLFAMGLQNSLVTRISNAVVRTTHLTGLFTDLGIELSQLFFCTSNQQKNELTSTIKLRVTIIIYFFLGGNMAGLFYSYLGFHVLIIPAVLLVIGLLYDTLKFKFLHWKRKNKFKV